MPDTTDSWQTHDLAFDPQRDDLRQQFQRREWLLTNGRGGYAMGTALGCNTRRYHGLLVAAAHPPVDRAVVLNQVFETLVLDNPGAGTAQRLEFSTCAFTDDHGQQVFAPHGFRYLARLQRGLTVKWHYRWGDLHWSRELILHHGQPAASLVYRLDQHDPSLGDARLEIRPMLTLRGFHALRSRDQDPGFVTTTQGPDTITVAAEHTGTFHAPGSTFTPAPDSWNALFYPVDQYRGQGDHEDYHLPGTFTLPLSPGQPTTITAALGDQPAAPQLNADERAQHLAPIRAHLAQSLKSQPAATVAALTVAADDFVVDRTADGQTLSTILAGYPWFADWGRDTFIALPGLLLRTGRFGEAAKVLRVFASSLRGGLVPNRFDDRDAGEAHYNTVDGSMWFVHAALEYTAATGQQPAWLLDAVTAVLDAHLDGTNASGHDGRPIPIRCDADGLITAGDDHTQLTWMDACCPTPQNPDGQVFTPRPGKCVEINALWVSNLQGAAELLDKKSNAAPTETPTQARGFAKQRPGVAARYRTTAARAAAAFNALFWSPKLRYLHDYIRPDGTPNTQLRPNMAFACSLPRSPLDPAHRKPVLDAIEQHLLTPAGLRTLAPSDPQYRPRYAGPQHERDSAYHQGTTWPWLIGAYAQGRLRDGNRSDAAKTTARQAITPLLQSLTAPAHPPTHPDATLGQLHEIHDGDPNPTGHHPARGCIAQAWSVAEVLRIAALLDE